jgi:hypothetical protein
MAPGLPGAIFLPFGGKAKGIGHNNRKNSIPRSAPLLWGSLEKSLFLGRIYLLSVKYPNIISCFMFAKALDGKEVPAQYPIAAPDIKALPRTRRGEKETRRLFPRSPEVMCRDASKIPKN